MAAPLHSTARIAEFRNFKHELEKDADLSHAEKTDRLEAQFEIRPTIQETIPREFDKHLIPLLFVIRFVDGTQIRNIVDSCIMQALLCVDRNNIGNTRIDVQAADLRLDGTKPKRYRS